MIICNILRECNVFYYSKYCFIVLTVKKYSVRPNNAYTIRIKLKLYFKNYKHKKLLTQLLYEQNGKKLINSINKI